MQFFPLCTFVSFVINEMQMLQSQSYTKKVSAKLRFHQNHGRIIVQSGAVGKCAYVFEDALG